MNYHRIKEMVALKKCLLNLLKHFSLVLALFLSGCVILPNKDPFPQQSISKLSSSYADKNLVRRLFGKPSSIKKGGEYWFYGKIREVVAILAGGAVIEDYEWLAVQFDDQNRVRFYEFNDDNNGCLSNGICNLGGLIFGKIPGVVLTAPELDDFHAKNYQVRDNECAVYFYQKPIFSIRSANYPVSLVMNNNVIGVINYETYLFFTHVPGEITFKSYQFEIQANCNAGEKLYLKVEEGWSVKEGKDLSTIASTAGELEIKKRRLALSD